ncbi:hypothetical protein, partial [Sulfitobacter geojensis]|uniref:hypothetical protein n=1 Tax=Sulfitobacter geojensis TaxID=1342299 RepID=UPI0010FDF1F2
MKKSSTKPRRKMLSRRRTKSLTSATIPKKFETLATAKKRSKKLIKAAYPADPAKVHERARMLLWQFDHPKNGDTRTLPAAQLRCFRIANFFCGLESCPICLAKFQPAVVSLIVDHFGDQDFVDWVTAIPPDGRVEVGSLASCELGPFQEALKRKLRKVFGRETLIIGAVDIGYRMHANKDRHWVRHLHFFVHPKVSADQEQQMKRLFADSSGSVHCPVKVETVPRSDLERVAAYTYKCFHLRKSSKDIATTDGTSKRGPGWPQPSQRPETMERHYAQSKNAVGDLLFLMGAKRKRSSDPFKIDGVDAPSHNGIV